MKNKFDSFSVYEVALFAIFLESMYAWFFIDAVAFVYLFAVLATFVFVSSDKKNFVKLNQFAIPIILYVLMRFYIIDYSSINSIIGNFLRVYVFIFVLVLVDSKKEELLKFFTKYFSFILLVSLIGWFINLFVFSLPSSTFSLDPNTTIDSFHNYYIFLTYINVGPYGLPAYRFMSIFIEPGHLGMIASFVLFANKFDLQNRYVRIIFFSTLLTFSLAAYVLCFVSYFSILITKKRGIVKYVAVFFLVLVLGYIFAIYYNNGDNLLNNYILKRLEIYNSTISGWNRFSLKLDNYFDSFLISSDVFFGIGFQNYREIFAGTYNAGYKVFIVSFGVVGLFIVFLFYYSVLRKYYSKLTVLFFIVFILSFIQRAYATWDVQILIFITALPSLNNNILKQKSK